jgi:hypothetical protein
MWTLPTNTYQIITHVDRNIAQRVCEEFHNANLPRNCSDVQVGMFYDEDTYHTWIIWYIAPSYWVQSTTDNFTQWANGFAWGLLSAWNQI